MPPAEQPGFLPDDPMPYVWNAGAHTFDLAQKQGLCRKNRPINPAPRIDAGKNEKDNRRLLRTPPFNSPARDLRQTSIWMQVPCQQLCCKDRITLADQGGAWTI